MLLKRKIIALKIGHIEINASSNVSTVYLGPDYMSQAGPVSRAASVWAGQVVM